MKNTKLNAWLWKWHFIAGMISLPFILLLSITGGIYLFNSDYEEEAKSTLQKVTVTENSLSFQEQLELVIKEVGKKPTSVTIPKNKQEATEFAYGRFGKKKSIYVDPYKASIIGTYAAKDTNMYTVRKLHGELLSGSFGTKIVELIASWMVVLIITGIFIWWPVRKWSFKGLFTYRTNVDKRTFFRDIHAVTGFWISIFLFLVLAGGFPWTDVVGSNFKWLQKVTNTGYPETWDGRKLQSEVAETTVSLDKMISIAKSLNLKGTISIGFPKSAKNTFSVSNKTIDLNAQKKFHFDQYSGEQIVKNDWKDVGILMRGRMWLMAFHQGEFGAWNWWLMFGLAILLTIMSAAAIISYVLRKRKDSWGIPKVPAKFVVGKSIAILIIVLGILFPLFGASIVVIYGYEKIKNRKKSLM
ncbi:PepSY-associated TM helix domain-containing protein [Kordia sp.]|uniref:PepSY-associated TM helix domain-containing protein n=1 Tax=Kordia sp. TaxID=1965332 RepID=UPI003B5B2121